MWWVKPEQKPHNVYMFQKVFDSFDIIITLKPFVHKHFHILVLCCRQIKILLGGSFVTSVVTAVTQQAVKKFARFQHAARLPQVLCNTYCHFPLSPLIILTKTALR